MREVVAEVVRECARGDALALATVVRTWRSAPRPAGASMLVTQAGDAVGSVSGGCVEGAVYEIGREVLADGIPRLTSFGVADADALAVGLSCGGRVEVFVEKLSFTLWPDLESVAADIRNGIPVAVATVVAGSSPELVGKHLAVSDSGWSGSLGTPRLDDTVAADAQGMLASGRTAAIEYGPAGERLGKGLEVFVASYRPPPKLIIIGAIDYSAALARIGKALGFHVTVCDARPVFATPRRLPDADEIVTDWPSRWLAKQKIDAGTAICVLTHEARFDVPALQVALASPAAFVGAMGSRRTHEDRLRRLLEAGATPSQLERLRSPIGLDIGARTPEETAISIAAEIIKTRWGGTGESLSSATGPIHHRDGT